MSRPPRSLPGDHGGLSGILARREIDGLPRCMPQQRLATNPSIQEETIMDRDKSTRRSFLKGIGAAGALAATVAHADGLSLPAASTESQTSPLQAHMTATRTERMKWWHEAKFGMFIHWGLYSVIGQHEWAKEVEGIPLEQYEQLAHAFKPQPNAARDWAKLAKQAGQKYMVMTTKHHEGFCHWDTKLTDYNAMKQGPGRDLVREFVDAARAEGLRVGFYYSLMDWHHPDGATCK